MKNHTTSTRVYSILMVAFGLVGAGARADVLDGTISRNVDGDTVWVEQVGRADAFGKASVLKIRMIGIDAPESCFPVEKGCVGQGHFGTDSKKKLAALLPLETEVAVDEHGLDKYGRTLGRVLKKGVDINLEMVRLGLAVTYIICEGDRCNSSFMESNHVEEYVKACQQARDSGQGQWNAKDPLKELPYEFRLRLSGRKPDKYVGNIETGELLKPIDYRKVDVCQRIFFMKKEDGLHAGFNFKN
ncbi:MAG: thermonuclease family protein [Deltaproteobacteria bacterium]|nr:thermonuclease family protein [Deltaproteobacteria bacterium]MBI3293362.1 thermonuclease family protein [Deltaproteobacteria bacterium]